MRFLFVIFFISTFSFSQSKKDLEDKITHLNNSLIDLQSQNNNLNTKIENIETQKKELDKHVNDFRTKYENVLNDRVSQEKTISSLEKTMDSLKTSAKISTVSKGSNAKLIAFDNGNASFTVPEGKRWEIVNVFSDYVVGGVVEYDEYLKKNELNNTSSIRIFIKDLNGVEKTNLVKHIYGTQLYRSSGGLSGFSYPIIFPEKTTFNLIVVKGDLGNLEMFDGEAYISLIEVDN